MPPKAKSKGPAPPGAQFAFSQRSAPPPPAPLPPYRRSDVARSILCIKDRAGTSTVLVSVFVSDGGRLGAKVVSSAPVVEEALRCPQCDLSNVVVTRVGCVDGGSAALIGTEKHGVLVLGAVGDEFAPVAGKDDILALRTASAVPGSAAPPSLCALSLACARRHGVALVDEDASSPVRVLGYGYTDMLSLSTPPPVITTVHPTDGLGRVPRPKQPLHEGALSMPFLSFHPVKDADTLSPQAVFASRNMTFLACRDGLYTCGTLSSSCAFPRPRLVLAQARIQVLNAVVVNHAAYVLCHGNRVWRLTAPSDCDADDPNPPVDEDGMPVFVDVTERLFGGALGDETPRDAPSKKLLLPNAQLSRMTGGADHVVVLDYANGRVYGWGNNAFGQLGRPTTTDADVLTATAAVEIPVPDGFASVHAVGMSTLILDGDKRLIQRYGGT